MENQWKEYLTFTKKERKGILILLLLIATCTSIPCFFPGIESRQVSIEKFRSELSQLQQLMNDSAKSTSSHPVQEEIAGLYYEPKNSNEQILFKFDPNTLNTDGWKQLGLQARTISTIRKYISKGGRFNKPEDLGKVYGLRKEDYARLLPYVAISALQQKETSFTHGFNQREAKHIKTEFESIDINTSDTTAFIALPGIGSKLAQRIINFREKLGGFYAVEQIAEIYGLPDSTFQLIKKYLQCTAPVIRKININMADVEVLKRHPYIKWNLANAIVQYRRQHGVYKTVNEVQQIAIVTPETYEKIVFYLGVE